MNLGQQLLKKNHSTISRELSIAAQDLQLIMEYLAQHTEEGLPYPVSFKTTRVDYPIFQKYTLPLLQSALAKENLYLYNHSYSHPYLQLEIVITG